MRFLANFFSWIIHPLLIPFYLFLIIAIFAPGFLGYGIPGLILSVIILVMTGILPGFNLILFKLLGTIPSLQLYERKERILPFAFITIIYGGVAFLFFYQYPTPTAFRILSMMAVASLTGTILTLFLKLSIHALSISASAVILIAIESSSYGGRMLEPAVLAVFLGGLVMSCRIYLGAHTLQEVFIGSITGIVIATIGMYLLF